MSLLKVEGLNKAFKGLHVLKSASLEVREGQRHVVIGPNGAGKTTLFNCIIGMLPADSGAVYIGEERVSGKPAQSRVASGMACTFQKNNLFESLTVEENVHLAIAARKPYRFRLWKPLSRHGDLLRETESLLREWGMWERRALEVDVLSYGEQRLLEMMLALASGPRILLLDEPTSGMSSAETSRTVELIRNMPRSVSLLVIEHDMEVVFAIADYITVLHHGEVFLSGPPNEVRGDERVKEIYFGGGARSDA